MIGNEKHSQGHPFIFLSMHLILLSLLGSRLGLASAQYTVYQPNDQVIFGGNPSYTKALSVTAAGAAAATYTGAAAYDPTVLQPPPPPNPPIPANQFIQLYSGGMNGLSKQQSGAFFGFSVEMSVATHVCMCLLMLGIPSAALTWFVLGSGKE
jgi:hypothetical protein